MVAHAAGGHGLMRAVLEVYSTSNMWADIPFAVVSGSIAVGGSILLVAVFWLIEYFILRNQRRNQYIRTDKANGYKQRRLRCGINLWQILFKSLFIIGLGVVIWVAGAVAGFNPYSTATAMLVMGVVVTYMFAGPLGAWGTSLALVWDNQLYIGQHWEFHGAGPGWEGVISGIYTFEVELMHRDETDGHVEIISVPISNFFNMMRKSDLRKEAKAKAEKWLVPAYQWPEVPKGRVPVMDQPASAASAIQNPFEVRVAFNTQRTPVQRRGGFHSTAPELL